MISIVAWVAIMCLVFFNLVNYMGQFRVSPTEEVLGLDISEMDADSIPHINEAVLVWRVR
jgi:ammonia channel protein AmtB